jgi:hypothetical protein
MGTDAKALAAAVARANKTEELKASLSGAMARAATVAQLLGESTDMLNESLVAAEKGIASLNLGVTASVTFDDCDENWSEVLTFGKLNSEWHLFFQSGPVDDEDCWTITPLTNASRERRLKAADLLPDLIQKLVETAEGQLAFVGQKIETVLQVVDTLSAGKRK